MYTSAPSFSRQSYRDRYRRRNVSTRSQLFNESTPIVQEKSYTVKLRCHRAEATLSFYDNNEHNKCEPIVSKWTIVRQRLPDILALSKTYKPTSVRAQLVLLLALMNKKPDNNLNPSHRLSLHDYDNTISHIVPSNVIIDIGGRSQLICLKRIPSEQIIHVDVDGLSFAIPTRQFILAISRGYAHETAAKYCPPAISDMLIDLSKTKIIDDRRQYKRAQFKMRLGQILFVMIFIYMITMMLALIISVTNFILKIDSSNETYLYISRSEWDLFLAGLLGSFNKSSSFSNKPHIIPGGESLVGVRAKT